MAGMDIDSATITTPHFKMSLPGSNPSFGAICILQLAPKHGFAGNVNVMVDPLPQGGL